MDMFGHQGACGGDAGDQQSGLDRGGRPQRLGIVEGTDIEAEDIAGLRDRARDLGMLREVIEQALTLGALSREQESDRHDTTSHTTTGAKALTPAPLRVTSRRGWLQPRGPLLRGSTMPEGPRCRGVIRVGSRPGG